MTCNCWHCNDTSIPDVPPAQGADKTFWRGYADGLRGHPPAEATESYLRGYTKGLSDTDV